MYLIGKGTDVMGPGTAMVQRIDWTRDQERQMMNGMQGRGAGLGCAGRGMGCAGLGVVPEFKSDCQTMNTSKGMGRCGMGCAEGGSGRYAECGLGLFDSGMDFTTWGASEWAIVGLGVYAGLSLLGDTKRGVERTRRIGRAVRKAA